MENNPDNQHLKKDPLIHFPFYCHQYLGRLLQFALEERGLFITALAILIVEDGNISDEILLRRSGIKNQQVSEINQKDNLAYLIGEVRLLADEIIAAQKIIRDTKRLNGSKGGRPTSKNNPVCYQVVSKNNQVASYIETEIESKTDTDINKEAKNNKSSSVDDFHLFTARRLADHIKSRKQLSITEIHIKSWAKDIALLEKKDLKDRSSGFGDIERAMASMEQYDGDKYFPNIESGKSFREKFTKIEDFLTRTASNKTNSNQFTKNVSASLEAINNTIKARRQNGL